jgi:hypothetical protein
MEQEIHVLGSERYMPRTREGVNVNRKAERLNTRREYKAGAEGRERFVREMGVLRMFGAARKGLGVGWCG